MKNSSRIISALVIVLILAQLVVILLSWILAATMPFAPIRSLLSDGGVRWMFCSFTESLASPLVIWILIYSMVWGAYRDSGMISISLSNLTFRKRLALRTIAVETLIFVALLLLFTVAPHAILLSITGALFTNEFFMGLIPTIAIFLMTIVITYGTITRNFTSVSSILDSISHGITSTSHIWVPYILTMLLIHSILYVVGG